MIDKEKKLSQIKQYLSESTRAEILNKREAVINNLLRI